ncbi:zinc finger and BTB domain-containing protein 12-like [Lampris incognitus]|uniref:zinc finger and BTB domain-containing protein 12-like n=1 Tax=Lampris incognitus TaxID=2546036 RepID=UPI0024B56AC6|nr:zinc finger and BTB domain-containing protein 12-like [Lampris incognitus]
MSSYGDGYIQSRNLTCSLKTRERQVSYATGERGKYRPSPTQEKMEPLLFRLPGHGDTTLKHMNFLRSRQNFCDITIVASENKTFRGHKVVLAACSPFLRDQFLLNPSSKLQVSVLHSSTVVCDLLQSCYTGVLKFNPEEIVNYLTAASYLQMEHIVERCRSALKKYLQPRNPSPPRIKTEESQLTPVIVSGSAQSVASISPPAGCASPVQQHSPAAPVLSLDENNSDDHTEQACSQHNSDSSELKESSVQVNASAEEEARGDDYDILTVYIPEEEQSAGCSKDMDQERAGPSSGPQEACFSETDVIMLREGVKFDLNPTEQDLDTGSFSREGLSLDGFRTFKRKLPEPKVGRGRGRGRGFKRWKWVSSQERRSTGSAHHQDLWSLSTAGMGGGFGLDYSQESLKAGNYLSIDLSAMDFSMGEAQGDVSPMAAGIAPYALEESSGNTGGGGSGLGAVPTNEGGDESVAVVGSTSSVAGPVTCEHCGMTFPSAHSLAIHSRSIHLLYACPCCGKHFHHSVSLTRHLAVHRGAGKTHQCPLCYKTFTQKSTLIDHMNLHSGERPHRCAYCHARFAHKPALRRHLKEQHGKTTGQNSLHEQEERERERGGGAGAGRQIREEEQERPITEQSS